jgi:hypothetical protein
MGLLTAFCSSRRWPPAYWIPVSATNNLNTIIQSEIDGWTKIYNIYILKNERARGGEPHFFFFTKKKLNVDFDCRGSIDI